jgi:hypothetical protein
MAKLTSHAQWLKVAVIGTTYESYLFSMSLTIHCIINNPQKIEIDYR